MLEMPFARWRKVDKQDMLIFNRRTPHLSVALKKRWSVLSATLKKWYVVTFFYKNFSDGIVF